MALQNSGTITMDDIGKEFRGPQPYDLQSHYRGGGKVPAQIPGFMNPPTGGNPTRGGTLNASTRACNATGPWNPANDTCFENPTMWCNHPDGLAQKPQIRNFSCPSTGNTHQFFTPCYDIGGPGSACGEKWIAMTPYKNLVDPNDVDGGYLTGYSYQNGNDPTPNPPGPNPPGPNPPNPTVPGNMNPPIPINTGVPSAGRIAVEDFYGARK